MVTVQGITAAVSASSTRAAITASWSSLAFRNCGPRKIEMRAIAMIGTECLNGSLVNRDKVTFLRCSIYHAAFGAGAELIAFHELDVAVLSEEAEVAHKVKVYRA